MSTYSKVALAVDLDDWKEVKPFVDEIITGHKILDKTTPDNTYRCIYWDYIVWDHSNDAIFNLLKKIECMRHALVTIPEDGGIWYEFETEDDRGCDGEFEQILSWKADICFWDENAPLADEYIPMTRERIIDIFKTYVSNDAEAAELEYVYEALSQAGCDDDDIKALGFGWVIPEQEV